jgi:ATP-dependent protease ClpP protease subunit
MLDIYTKKCAKGNFFKNNNKYKTPVSIKNFIRKNIDRKGDWYMTAEEAVDYGFADAVLGQKGYENIECLISKK